MLAVAVDGTGEIISTDESVENPKTLSNEPGLILDNCPW